MIGAIYSILLALVVLGASSTAAAQRCSIRGRGPIAGVRIAPQEPAARQQVSAFTLDVDLHVEVTEGRGANAIVRATGNLVFEGTVPQRSIPIELDRTVTVAGALTLRSSTPIEAERLGSARVNARLEPGVIARSLQVPCESLVVGQMVSGQSSSERAAAVGTLVIDRNRVRVHGHPGGPSVLVVLEAPRAPVRVEEVARRPGLVHVRREFATGAMLDGWVTEGSVRAAGTLGELRLGEAMIGALGTCGRGASHTYIGPATLLAGSEVLESRGGVSWARARGNVELREVEIPWGADWAQITQVEGVRRDGNECVNLLDRAWVPVSALRFPAGAHVVLPASGASDGELEQTR